MQTQQIGLPFSGRTPISCHRSAQAAQAAAATRVTKTLRYLDLLKHAGTRGITDHEAASAMALPLSSINSIRNGCGGLVEPRTDEHGLSPYGRKVTLWKHR